MEFAQEAARGSQGWALAKGKAAWGLMISSKSGWSSPNPLQETQESKPSGGEFCQSVGSSHPPLVPWWNKRSSCVRGGMKLVIPVAFYFFLLQTPSPFGGPRWGKERDREKKKISFLRLVSQCLVFVARSVHSAEREFRISLSQFRRDWPCCTGLIWHGSCTERRAVWCTQCQLQLPGSPRCISSHTLMTFPNSFYSAHPVHYSCRSLTNCPGRTLPCFPVAGKSNGKSKSGTNEIKVWCKSVVAQIVPIVTIYFRHPWNFYPISNYSNYYSNIC